MTKIIASAQQRKCRYMFKEAVGYAQHIMADPAKKAEWLKKVKKKHRVFNQIIKYFMLEDKRLKEQRERVGARMIRRSFIPVIAAEPISYGKLNVTGNIIGVNSE